MATRGTAAWANAKYGSPGVPGSAQGATFRRNNIVAVQIGGRTMYVHRKSKRLWKWFDRSLKFQAPDYWDQVNNGTYDDWGYAHRYIAGTKTLSNHSWGLATDIDATKNPRTSDPDERKSYIWRHASGFITRVEKVGALRWGGRYSSPDPMHFEVLLSPWEIRLYFYKDGRMKPRAVRKLKRGKKLTA